MTIAVEEKRLRSLFERVEVVEDVARTLPEDDERRARLLAVSDSALAEEGTIRPVIAARLLGLSEKTVRSLGSGGRPDRRPALPPAAAGRAQRARDQSPGQRAAGRRARPGPAGPGVAPS